MDTDRASHLRVFHRTRLSSARQIQEHGFHPASASIEELIDVQLARAQQAGRSERDELATLIPLTTQVLPYTAAADPEIEWPLAAAPS